MKIFEKSVLVSRESYLLVVNSAHGTVVTNPRHVCVTRLSAVESKVVQGHVTCN